MSRLIVLFLIAFAPAPALAQTMAEKIACKDDVKAYCAGVQPGGGRVLDCLAPYKDKISEVCRKALDTHGK
jgi:hypothetical protein